VGINAYHQPGVEAGKKAAASVLLLQKQVLQVLQATPQNAEQIADHVGAEPETVFLLLEHLVANGRARQVADSSPSDRQFARV
jgi:glucose-6-phosphate isomerase